MSRKRVSDYFFIGRRYKKEFKRQIRMLIIITLGFTIAFTWRQTIFDLSQSFVNLILHTQNSPLSSVLTSIFLTVLSLTLILFTAHLLQDNPRDKQLYINF
ncbi:hypothetical protein K9L16_03770 [Candidatus Pacearchaeota archaeon]|nr:hypothetical protein [Candidatus Pacearchaeota archaeon]